MNALQNSRPAVSKFAGSLGVSATDREHAAAAAAASSAETPAASPRSATILHTSNSGNSLSTGHVFKYVTNAVTDAAPGGSPPLHAAATSPIAPSSAPNSESFLRIPSNFAASNASGVFIGRNLNAGAALEDVPGVGAAEGTYAPPPVNGSYDPPPGAPPLAPPGAAPPGT